MRAFAMEKKMATFFPHMFSVDLILNTAYNVDNSTVRPSTDMRDTDPPKLDGHQQMYRYCTNFWVTFTALTRTAKCFLLLFKVRGFHMPVRGMNFEISKYLVHLILY